MREFGHDDSTETLTIIKRSPIGNIETFWDLIDTFWDLIGTLLRPIGIIETFLYNIISIFHF